MEDDPLEFDLSTSCISAMVCYLDQGGSDTIAIAMDDYTIQAFSTEVTMGSGVMVGGEMLGQGSRIGVGMGQGPRSVYEVIH